MIVPADVQCYRAVNAAGTPVAGGENFPNEATALAWAQAAGRPDNLFVVSVTCIVTQAVSPQVTTVTLTAAQARAAL